MNSMYRMYWNQNLWCINPLMRHVIIVCISSFISMAKGRFICVNIALSSVLIIISVFISGGSLV
jgi:hypothetical protein